MDLSDSGKIIEAAQSIFGSVINAINVQFPISDQELQAIDEAYGGRLPSYINIQQGRRRHWRGQIWKATDPR